MRTRTPRRRTAALAAAAVAGTAIVALSGIVATAAGLDLNNGTATPFHLAKAGPVNQLDGLPAADPLHDPSANGFPYWYGDGTDTLELCLDKPVGATDNCALTGVLPDPNAPITFPQERDAAHNFPDEAFYWMATGGGDIGAGANAGKTLVTMAVEAAFVNGPPQPGEQMVFARTRLRLDIPETGRYTVVWPYGKKDFDATAGGRTINVTQDVGLAPGQFTDALTGNIGPFLRWDASPPAAPDGFLGDAGTLHDVTGSPYEYGGRAANFVRIEGPVGAILRTAGGANACPDRPADTNCVEYPQFSVLGKKAVRSGVEGTRATYTRTGSTTHIDLFGHSAPGAHLQAAGNGIPSTDLDADAASGFYFTRLGLPTTGFNPADTIVLRNLTDVPGSRSIVRVTDAVTIDEATYYNTPTAGHQKGDLVVTARTSDDQNNAPLTVVDVGNLPAGATVDGPRTATFADGPGAGISAPPAILKVTSAMGGSASVAVKIVGDASPAAATSAAVSVSGQTGPGGHALPEDELTLIGSNSVGGFGAWRWTIDTPTAGSPGFAAAAHEPVLMSGSLSGLVTVADPAVHPITVRLPAAPADNVAHDVSFTLELYPDQAAMTAGTGALDVRTVIVHVDPAATPPVVAFPAAATRVRAPVATRVTTARGRVRARIVVRATAPKGNRCVLRTTKQVLARKACGRTQTVFVVTAKRGTVVYVQISGKRQTTVTTKRIRL
jgi:hypothetical protein